MKFSTIIIGLGIVNLMVSCEGSEKEKQIEVPKNKVVNLPAPFKKHLKIEVGPELIFDIFSWGRGSDSTSSVLVLRSDSLKNDFSVASTDNLDGRLQEVFNTDMDNDGNPEVLVYYTLNDKIESAAVLCYEFNGKNVNKIRFPDLTSATKKQYRGVDKFYVKDGMLFREFNLYESEDQDAKNPTDKKVIQYFIKGNSFDLKEVE
ncbi:MAG: hypothetical protein ABIP95_07915 [Pelobium sp.]